MAEYGDYIERLFAAKRSTSHGQVILFDKGVRNEVGGGQVILLTDYQYFTSLYAATLQDDGVEYHRGRRGGGGGRPGSQKDEVCLRFNGQAGSVLKSGPVSVLLPFLEGPRTGPVPEGFKMQELRTGTAKNRKKPVITGRNRSQNEYNKTRARSAKLGHVL